MSGIGADGKYFNYISNNVKIELFLNLFIILLLRFLITINTII